MRIGILASVSDHLDAFWIDIAGHFEEAGHAVSLAAGDAYDDPRYHQLNAITRSPKLRNYGSMRQIREWERREKLDAIVTNTATSSALVRLARVHAPIIYFAHGFHWDLEKGINYHLWSTPERLLLNRAEAMIVLNREDENWIRKSGYNNNVKLLEFGVGLPLHQFPKKDMPSNSNAVWIGEFSKRKRPLLAIQIANEIHQRNPKFRLTMLGKGALHQESRQLAHKLGLEEVVNFPGHVHPASYLASASILLHTATWEGLPRVVLEALATGRPVVGPDVKGLRGLPGVITSRDDSPAALADIAVEQMCEEHPVEVDRSMLGTDHAASEMLDFIKETLQ